MAKKYSRSFNPFQLIFIVPVIALGLLMVGITVARELRSQAASSADILWSTGHEDGTYNDWFKNQSGSFYPTGNGKVSASQEAAHSGSYAMKHQVTGISSQMVATRIFRWAEHLKEGYFSCWYMFPEVPQVNGWINIFQFKKHDYADQGGTGAIDPTWYNEIKNGRLTLSHWHNDSNVEKVAANVGTPPAIEPGKWFHLEWHYKDGTNDGEIGIWIDGQQYWDLKNVETRGVHPDIQWAPSLYGQRVTPDPLTMYIDDCAISKTRLGPNGLTGGSPLPSVSIQPTPSVSPSPSTTPSLSPSPSVRPTPSASPSVRPTPSASPSVRPSPSATPVNSPSPVPSPTPPVTSLFWEAERGMIISPFQIKNTYIVQQEQTGLRQSGRASYRFKLNEPGSYTLKALVNAPDDGSDSIFVNIDEDPNSNMIWDIPWTRGYEEETLVWRGQSQPKVFNLSAGNHELIIRGREAGTQIDKLWLVPTSGSTGNTHGLTGVYYDRTDFKEQRITRVDPTINFNWGKSSPANKVRADRFSVRWTGMFTPTKSGNYTFYLTADDGGTLWINDKPVVQNNPWFGSSRDSREKSGTMELTANKPYRIKIEYYDYFGDASISLSYSHPEISKQVIPSEELSP